MHEGVLIKREFSSVAFRANAQHPNQKKGFLAFSSLLRSFRRIHFGGAGSTYDKEG